MIHSAGDFGASVRHRGKARGWTQAERLIVEPEAGKPSCRLEKALIAARAVGCGLVDARSTSPASSDKGDDKPGSRGSALVRHVGRRPIYADDDCQERLTWAIFT
jgi:hypothetical protein